ncbi:hypothetical protein DUNSADRAFT_1338 [Dunaliella salina]|uniref:Uncharacterized protein n=1 Tax=Dunaliella salina TaxID=3046 RepID=A0ABQ7GXD0_DUNSA|nr:hypothetical protein DUNSADRAFT_1338 [Dunaliella salina]|eukprot:KAF5839202.1 hypothetical protein DUNSADRAFT_1338 [Dunaliella salina]
MGVQQISTRAGLLSFQQVQFWSIIVFCGLLSFVSKQGCDRYFAPAIVLMVLAVCIFGAARRRQYTAVWWPVLFYSLLKSACLVQRSFSDSEKLILNMRSVPLLLFLLCNAGAGALYYRSVVGHSVLVAILRASGVQAVSFCAFAMARHSIVHSSLHTAKKGSGSSRGEPKQLQYKQHQLKELQLQEPEELQQHEKGEKAELVQGGSREADVHPHSSNASHHQHGRDANPGPNSVAGAECGRIKSDTTSDISAMPESSSRAWPQQQQEQERQQQQEQQQRQQQQEQQQRQQQQEQQLRQQQEQLQRALDRSQMLSDHLLALDRQRGSAGTRRSSVGSPSHTLPTLNLSGFADPAVQRALLEAARARARNPHEQLYSSKFVQPASHTSRTLESLQAACRFAVKVNGPGLQPDSMPGGAVPSLQERLRRLQQFAPSESPAMRAGCVVISFGALPRGQGQTLQEMSEDVAAVAKEWARGLGLLTPEEGPLTVQACPQPCSSSGHHETQPSEFNMAVRTPIVIMSPAFESTGLQDSQQLEGADVHEPHPHPSVEVKEDMCCEVQLALIAPPHFELQGWRGAAGDAPEDLPDGAKQHSLCCLASLDGQFVPTSVELCTPLGGKSRERLVKVQVSLHKTMRDVASLHPKVLVLELWAAGALVGSHSVALLPGLYTGALAELQGWGGHADNADNGEKRSAFIRDLSRWLHYQASSLGALQQEQQQGQGQGQGLQLQTPSLCDAREQQQEAEGALPQEQRKGQGQGLDVQTSSLGDVQEQQQQRQQEQQEAEGVAAGETSLQPSLPQGDAAAAQQEPCEEEQLLSLMATVGRDLLAHSLGCGMITVAGLVLDGLASFPFCLSASALLGEIKAEAEQLDHPQPGGHQQNQAPAPGPKASLSEQRPTMQPTHFVDARQQQPGACSGEQRPPMEPEPTTQPILMRCFSGRLVGRVQGRNIQGHRRRQNRQRSSTAHCMVPACPLWPWLGSRVKCVAPRTCHGRGRRQCLLTAPPPAARLAALPRWLRQRRPTAWNCSAQAGKQHGQPCQRVGQHSCRLHHGLQC